MDSTSTPQGNAHDNRLFPVFLKLEELKLLIVGGGNVGFEKLTAVINNAPNTDIILVAASISPDLKQFAAGHANITLVERCFLPEDARDRDLAIVAVNDPEESKRIRTMLKRGRMLVNVADQPGLCDFYLGSIVQKGNLKVGISTNGKSPTVAKRLKEWLNDVLPDELDALLNNMQGIRQKLKGDFRSKVEHLNAITRELAEGDGLRAPGTDAK